jgi:hypothetical protein
MCNTSQYNCSAYMSVILVVQEQLDEYHQGYQMKKVGMGDACGTYWDKRKAYRVWLKNLNKKTTWKT